jgi:hypothetical protein
VILGKQFDRYDVQFDKAKWSMPGKTASRGYEENSFQLNFKSEKMNQRSPVLGLHELGANCVVRSFPENPWKQVDSMAQLQNSGVNSYFSAGSVLYVRFVSSETAESTSYASSNARQGRSKYALINCQ